MRKLKVASFSRLLQEQSDCLRAHVLNPRRTGSWWGSQVGAFRVTVTKKAVEVPDAPSSRCRVVKYFLQIFLLSLPLHMSDGSHRAWPQGQTAFYSAEFLLSVASTCSLSLPGGLASWACIHMGHRTLLLPSWNSQNLLNKGPATLLLP